MRLPRWLITIPTLVYGVIPPFVDLTGTHVFHPAWTPHSRMHMVWLPGTNSSVALLALWLMWGRGTDELFRTRQARAPASNR